MIKKYIYLKILINKYIYYVAICKDKVINGAILGCIDYYFLQYNVIGKFDIK